MKKTSFIHCKLDSEIKSKLKKKAEDSGLNLTGFIEKIAKEDLVFLDENVKKLLDAIKLKPTC